MKYIFIFLLLFTVTNLHAQAETAEERPYVNKNFVIIISTKSYTAAKTVAVEAASKLKLKLNLRGLKPNKGIGLTQTTKECEGNGWDYPCYVSRGRYDDGEFVTIDYSDAFKGFAKGYYIVTSASGDAASIKKALIKVKQLYKTAYAKQTEVYIGCLH